jgi:Fuc2NAc and GlcNAc transferase
VGILAAFILAGLTLRIPPTFLFAVVLVSAVSFYGDYFRLSVKFRLIVQLISALVFLLPLLPRLGAEGILSGPAFTPPLFLVVPLIILFIMATANFYNFMDGINGIAGLSGVIAFGSLGVYALNRPSPDDFQTAVSLLPICIALACLGFLPFNMRRARVFMGDVGSILLGFVFAALVVALARNVLDLVCFAALLFPFYADELTTMAVRLLRRENLTRSHRCHLYQLLVNELGISHWKVSLGYGAAQIAVIATVAVVRPLGAKPVLILLIICFVAFILLTVRIRKWIRERETGAVISRKAPWSQE